MKEEVLLWPEFAERVRRFALKSWAGQRHLLFRGQGNGEWTLRPTLDRLRPFETTTEREAFLGDLLGEFWTSAAGLHEHQVASPTSLHAEMIARHHGIPTAVLDWTRSPYVAAFFAFDSVQPDASHAAIWVLKRQVFLELDASAVSLDEDSAVSTRNYRSIEQDGVFTRLNGVQRDLDQVVSPGLQKLLIPISERSQVLRDLDLMHINARALYRDLDGVARTTVRRVIEFSGDDHAV